MMAKNKHPLFNNDPLIVVEELTKALAPAKERLRKERSTYIHFSDEYKKHPERFNKPKTKGHDAYI